MKKSLLAVLLAFLLICCNESGKPEQVQAKSALQLSKDSILFSFVFVGCNRLDHGDVRKQQPYDGSTANRAVLKWIFDQVMQLPHQPASSLSPFQEIMKCCMPAHITRNGR